MHTIVRIANHLTNPDEQYSHGVATPSPSHLQVPAELLPSNYMGDETNTQIEVANRS